MLPILVALTIAVGSFLLGRSSDAWLATKPKGPTKAQIDQSIIKSGYGANHPWAEFYADLGKKDLIQKLRRGGRVHCFNETTAEIDKECADMQDSEITRAAWTVLTALEELGDAAPRNPKEDQWRQLDLDLYWDRESLDNLMQKCEEVYDRTATRDAYIFVVCMGNVPGENVFFDLPPIVD